jgi:hypothetical protein
MAMTGRNQGSARHPDDRHPEDRRTGRPLDPLPAAPGDPAGEQFRVRLRARSNDRPPGTRPAAGPDPVPGGRTGTGLRPGVAALLRADLADLPGEIAGAVRQGVPEFSRLTPGQARNITLAVDHALRQFVDQVADPAARRHLDAGVYRRLGRGEQLEGRSLGALRAAFRLGTRIATRRLVNLTRTGDLTPDEFCLLAEAVFAHVDAITACAAEGYEEARANAAGALRRRRRRLLDLILAETAVPHEALTDLATAAGWPLPATVACVAVAAPDDRDDLDALLPAGLGDAVLADLRRRDPVLLVPDPDGPGTAEMLDSALAGCRAAVGPTVPLYAARRSLRWAREALALVERGVIPGDGVVHCADQFPTMMLAAGGSLLRPLAARRLEPLAHLAPKARTRLEETLLAWLETGRAGAPEVAALLNVHPQTVRHRLHKLEDLFGERLQDPQVRFELWMALRARRLLDRTAPATAPTGHAAAAVSGTAAGTAAPAAPAAAGAPLPPAPGGHGLPPAVAAALLGAGGRGPRPPAAPQPPGRRPVPGRRFTGTGRHGTPA